METIIAIGEPIVLIVGSILVALFLCRLLGQTFRLLRRPEWGAALALPAIALGLYGSSADNVFLRLVLTFTLLESVPLWLEARTRKGGYARAPTKDEPRQHREPSLVQQKMPQRYPIIDACIREGRRPRHGELRVVADRIWREGIQRSLGPPNPVTSFAMRRSAFRAARAALEGNSAEKCVEENSENLLCMKGDSIDLIPASAVEGGRPWWT